MRKKSCCPISHTQPSLPCGYRARDMEIQTSSLHHSNPQHQTHLHHHYGFSHHQFFNQNHHSHLTKPSQNQSTWSCLIKKLLYHGPQGEALTTYNQIRRNGLYLLGIIPLILKACASTSMLTHGKSFHSETIKNGVDVDVVIGTSLIGMYSKCGDIFSSRKIFDYMPQRSVIAWNAMIGGYIKNGDMNSASILFEAMLARNSVTWIEMIDGLARSGDLVSARFMFNQVPPELKNVVTWTVMVDGYANKGQMSAARMIFESMPEKNFFVWSSMVSGYCKIGDVKEGRAIFDRIPVRNLVNWNSLISGYAQNGFCQEALEAFWKMLDEGFEPDEVTVVSVLSACAQLGLLDVGKDVHLMISRKGFAIHGRCKEALEFFRRMEESNERPDDITFLVVLSAFAHGGFVHEGVQIFSTMEKYGLAAGIEHYSCMVDLLARAGRLQDAYQLIKRMPMKPNDTIWGAFLGGCRTHLDLELVEQVMQDVTTDSSLDTGNDPHFVLLSNIYAASNSWEKAERMRMTMVNRGHQKSRGCSSLMLRNKE